MLLAALPHPGSRADMVTEPPLRPALAQAANAQRQSAHRNPATRRKD